MAAGETFWSIGQRLGASADAVAALNPGVEPTALQIGQTIQVPCAAAARRQVRRLLSGLSGTELPQLPC